MHPKIHLAAAAAILAITAAALAEGDETAPPRLLSETGLYVSGGTAVVDARNRPFAPQYPLWTDGAAKARWIRLPEGSAIDARDEEAWRFPVGTKLWKEFSFGGRRVETRMIWKTGEARWVYAAYVWNEDGTDAVLAPSSGIRGAHEIAPGKRHSIPSVADCKTCHEAGPKEALGFTALQLSDDRDPLAPHAEPLGPAMVTVRTLVAEGVLRGARPDLAEVPPRIEGRTPRERAVLGYLSSNCGTCHNREGPLGRLGLVLSHDPTLETTLDVPGRYLVPGIPPEASRRIAPGAPEASAVLQRMRSRRPVSQMPPLGTVLPDGEATALVEGWIREDLATRSPSR